MKQAGKLKYAWVAPATLLFHVFDEPVWFKQMGVKGYPLYMLGTGVVWFINVLIMLSTFAFCLESLPAFCSDPSKYSECPDPEFWETTWFFIEILCVACFTIDFLVRLICSFIMGPSELKRFINDPMNTVDVVAVFPFYLKYGVELLLNMEFNVDLRFVRVLRLARVLRSLPERYAGMGTIVVDIVNTAYMPLLLPLFFMFIGMICFASMAYYVERPYDTVCYLDGDTGNSLPWYREDSLEAGIFEEALYKDEGLGPELCPKTGFCHESNFTGNLITHWKSCKFVDADDNCVTEGTAGARLVAGNEGCLTNSACVCGCDGPGHWYNKQRLLWQSCSKRTVPHDLKTENGGDYDECPAQITDAEESDWNLPNVTGSCTGVIQFRTWDFINLDNTGGEYSSDMFEDGKAFPENGAPGGIGTAMWWCVVTFTTVGYGDMNPRTPQGQFVAVFTMTCGVFFLAMPLAVVGGSFNAAYTRSEAEHEIRENEKIIAAAAKRGEPPPEVPPTPGELVEQLYSDDDLRLQDTKAYLVAVLASTEHVRELAGGLEEFPEMWKRTQDFQAKIKGVLQKLVRPPSQPRRLDLPLWLTDCCAGLRRGIRARWSRSRTSTTATSSGTRMGGCSSR